MTDAALDTPMLEGDLAFDDGDDLQARLRALREQAPIASATFLGRPSVLFLSYELVDAALRDEEHFPAWPAAVEYIKPSSGHTMQCMTGDEHRINRGLAMPSFRARPVMSYHDTLRAEANALVDGFAARGECDLVADFASVFPFTVISRMLGLPRSADADLRRWGRAIINYAFDPEPGLAAKADFTEFLEPLLAQRRSRPEGDDLISVLAHQEVDRERLDDEAILTFIRLLFPAGTDTTNLAIGNALLAVLEDPAIRAQAMSGTEGVVDVTEESLRMEPPVGVMPRILPTAIDWRGMHLEAGTQVLLGIMSANRDPAAFLDPERFDPARRPKNILTFGFGTHFCLGAHLARAKVQASIEVLLQRLPDLRLRPGAHPKVTGAALRGTATLPVVWDVR
jgi:cytochrome P450